MSDLMDFFMGRKALRKAAGTDKAKKREPKADSTPGYSQKDMAKMAEDQKKRSRKPKMADTIGKQMMGHGR